MDSRVDCSCANEVRSACVLMVTLDSAPMVEARPVQVCMCV